MPPSTVENLGRMMDEEAEIVEQHVAGAPPRMTPSVNPQDEIIHLHSGSRRAAPQLSLPDQRSA